MPASDVPYPPSPPTTERIFVLDSGALIAGGDALFALGGLVDASSGEAMAPLAAGELVTFSTVPEVMYEARDPRARARLALLKDSIVIRSPSPRAVDAVVSFAKATGDFPALSVVDLKVLALTWMLDTEKNGHENLRETPLQPKFGAAQAIPLEQIIQEEDENSRQEREEAAKKMAETEGWEIVEPKKSNTPNRSKISRKRKTKKEKNGPEKTSEEEGQRDVENAQGAPYHASEAVSLSVESNYINNTQEEDNDLLSTAVKSHRAVKLSPGLSSDVQDICESLSLECFDFNTPSDVIVGSGEVAVEENQANRSSDVAGSDFIDDGMGWINEHNLDEHLAQDIGSAQADSYELKRVGCVTTDFAMQNVLLQMGLKLVSVDGRRIIRGVRRYVLRCHSCSYITQELDRTFCGRCGNASLTRVTFKIDSDGNARIFLSTKFRHRLRGTKYPIPMPRGGRNNKDLILCEDQIDPSKVRWLEKRRERMMVDVLDPNATYNSGAQYNPLKPFVVGYGSRNPNEGKPSSKKSKRK